MTLKTCTKCKTEFPDTNDFFYIRNEKGCKRRLSTECLNCHNERGKKWAKNNPEKVKVSIKMKHRDGDISYNYLTEDNLDGYTFISNV